MIRAQRRRHLVIWLILGPLILLGLVLGLSVRREAPVQDAAQEVVGQVQSRASLSDGEVSP